MVLHQQSVKQGYDIKLVVFDPKLQPYLFKTRFGNYLKTKLKFTTKRAWVRHDDHYHVVFDVPCESMWMNIWDWLSYQGLRYVEWIMNPDL